MKRPLMMPVSLSTERSSLTPVVAGNGWTLCSVAAGSEAATRTIDFIRQRFWLAYQAQPKLRIPDLLALVSGRGELIAAVGIRCAEGERLFLEDYLDQPVEQLIPGTRPDRRHLTEIAHLAGAEAGAGRYLFPALSKYLLGLGSEWVVCTGTPHLRNGFERLGIEVHPMGAADPSRLADQGKCWGQYYDHNPEVMALSVEQGHQAMERVGLMRTIADAAPESGSGGGNYGVIA
ncbi:thermostable hemolysin [Halospina sp. K52047b]|uniref:thermostable hemolysin n=1 Tax=Halospina sp. K52047b TaxID=2614160 RepID=UPI001787AAEF|nr:thermostable hemolysin [Halospina sp. K52047b]